MRTVRKGHRHIFGFTFVELLIAVSIFAIVALALYSTFFAGISVWKRSGEGGNITQAVRFIFDDMARDLRNSVYLTGEEESVFTSTCTSEEITFFSVEPSSLGETMAQREFVKVSYTYDKDEKQVIRRRADKEVGFKVEEAEKEILLNAVEEFTIEYCYDTGDDDDPYEWKDEWEDEERRLPKGVRITSELGGAGRGEEPVSFKRIMHVPLGVLGEEELGI